jgi:hypothetical protein
MDESRKGRFISIVPEKELVRHGLPSSKKKIERQDWKKRENQHDAGVSPNHHQSTLERTKFATPIVLELS